jgi:hypothetical protein
MLCTEIRDGELGSVPVLPVVLSHVSSLNLQTGKFHLFFVSHCAVRIKGNKCKGNENAFRMVKHSTDGGFLSA